MVQGPIKFFFTILLPLSRTNIAALFVITFIYGWNQYLCANAYHHRYSVLYFIVMGIKQMVAVSGWRDWVGTKIMATTLIANVATCLYRHFDAKSLC